MPIICLHWRQPLLIWSHSCSSLPKNVRFYIQWRSDIKIPKTQTQLWPFKMEDKCVWILPHSDSLLGTLVSLTSWAIPGIVFIQVFTEIGHKMKYWKTPLKKVHLRARKIKPGCSETEFYFCHFCFYYPQTKDDSTCWLLFVQFIQMFYYQKTNMFYVSSQ